MASPSFSRNIYVLVFFDPRRSKSKTVDNCFNAGGDDISRQAKRDVGVQLSVTITYSNV
jgi:hypothetical protein